jgi:hypothetical protein
MRLADRNKSENPLAPHCPCSSLELIFLQPINSPKKVYRKKNRDSGYREDKPVISSE